MGKRLKARLESLEKNYELEEQNETLSRLDHKMVAAYARFQNELSLFPEQVLFSIGKAKTVEDNFKDAVDTGAYQKDNPFFSVDVKQAYNIFVLSRDDYSINQKSEQAEWYMHLYNKAKDYLNVTIKDHLEKIDKKYGTHYFNLARFGELKLSSNAKSFEKQKEEALLKFTEIKLSNPNLTAVQHDFVANLAFYRHELHVNADNFLVSSESGKQIEKIFNQLIDRKIFNLMGFDLQNRMLVAYKAMLESRDKAAASIKSADLQANIEKYVDDKERFNDELEVFLEHVDKLCKTTYAPKKDHRLDPKIARQKEIHACLKKIIESGTNTPPEFSPYVLPEQQPQIDIKEVLDDLPEFTAVFDKDVTLNIMYMDYDEGYIPKMEDVTIPQGEIVPVSILKSGAVIIEAGDIGNFTTCKNAEFNPVAVPKNVIENNDLRIFDSVGNHINFKAMKMEEIEDKKEKLTEAQKIFFKDSQMKNSKGEMITCYHYTTHRFDAFDKGTISNTSGDNGYFGKGFYFTAQPSFNSCCFPDKKKGEKLIKLECYLDLKNPFYIEKLGKPDYEADNPFLYDAENFLLYIKNNADSKAFTDNGVNIVCSEDDFVKYLKEEHAYDGEFRELIEKYERDEIDFYEEIDGVSLDKLQHDAERNDEIITPYNITFNHLHRGLLDGYSEQISDYAKSNGFDGIISDGLPGELNQPTEIVVFEPEQIKAVDNQYPTKSPNFKDNKEEYFANKKDKDITEPVSKEKRPYHPRRCR